MPYDEELAARIRAIVAGEPALTDKKMFGGIAFVTGGNMAVAASGHSGLMGRVDPAQSGMLISATPARMVEMRGRLMSAWVYLEAADLGAFGELTAWVKPGFHSRGRCQANPDAEVLLLISAR